ncbi:ABC transporter transmembrane domain-containing protein [Thermomonospora umbrina]|uniref:ABC-type multidrug transport system fused ATPase/permease subunit n=1 Tax=Thermomonospora umbrina TaxID=111806 RepID=A0A3D9SJB9_9ACTN|nr:ABC transporter ATP-binding protein [Thermomonospora umbrina]REE96022.1 ABC-type multidrug transport system fused ATPase/permease subunit [Thermomonospora umbrina]
MKNALPVPDPGVADHRSPWRYLTWLARRQGRPLLYGIGWGVTWMLSMALTPAVIGRAIDDGVAAKDAGALVTWSAVLLGLALLTAASSGLRHRLAVFCWLSAAYRTVQVVTRQSTRLGATLSKRMSAGEVVSVGISDVSHIGDALDIVIRGTAAVIAIVAVIVLMLIASPPLGLVVLVGVPLILLVAAPLMRPYRRRHERLRELVGDLNTRATDIVAGLRVLRGIGGEHLFADRYREESQRVRRAGVETARAESMLSGAEVLLPGLLVVAVTWMGARYAVSDTMTPGELITVYGYAVFLVHPLATLGEAADKITKGYVAAGRVVRILALDPDLPADGTAEPSGAELVDPVSGLVAWPGGLTAVAAADPADADAIADRLGHYAEVEGADVTYGGVPLRDLARLRERIIVTVNDDVLLSGRLADTLTGGVPGRDLAGPIRAASADDIVDTVGRDAHVVEAGREFSGGQQQRLRLVRALAADPEVLVLVEPTSAVDAHTEARIAERLGEMRAGRTTVVCTTSPLVLDRADQVAFVENGVVVAEGAHRELLDREPRYAATVTRGEDRDRVTDHA